jgi:F-type H+-transporting ATPase subunit epsilon
MEQDKLLDVEIVTPQRVIYHGKAVSVTVAGSESPFQILNMHAPIVSTLEVGITKIVDETDKPIYFATTSGFTEVHKNKVSILVEDACASDEVVVDTVKIELNKAKEMAKDSGNTDELRNAVLFAENKLKIAEK